MASIRTVVFDLDDTLLDTGPVYDKVLGRFASEVLGALPGLDAPTVRATQEEIDVKAASEVGFGKDRFPWSLAETYRVLARRCRQPPDVAIERRLVALGLSVFDSVPVFVEGARELLDGLRGSVELLLYTLGVPEVQRVKIEHHGLDRLFDEVHIVPDKTTARLRSVLGTRPPAGVMVVGDSLRGEIGPALELGCRAVLVRRPLSWGYHRAKVSGRYETVETITAVRDLLAT